jgi:hypothetical protein
VVDFFHVFAEGESIDKRFWRKTSSFLSRNSGSRHVSDPIGGILEIVIAGGEESEEEDSDLVVSLTSIPDSDFEWKCFETLF